MNRPILGLGSDFRRSGSATRKESLATLALAVLVFIVLVWPVLSGKYAFAPRSRLAAGSLAPSFVTQGPFSLRDNELQGDFLDQERIFLRFYRESVQKGELPFWNERTFGGISQEDSMIYSYLSPLHWVFLLIDDDHRAKAVQIILLLTFGLIGVRWWGRIVGLPEEWSLLTGFLVVLSPLALHFQGHTHQPALYYSGMYVGAAVHLFLEKGRTRDLVLFFLFFCLAIASNFLSILLFISFLIFFISLAHLVHSDEKKGPLIKRLAVLTLAYAAALGSLTFFLGPMYLESFLVREPVPVNALANSPVLNPYLTIYSLFAFVKNTFSPFWVLLPPALVFVLVRWRKNRPPLGVIALFYFWVFAALLPASPFLQGLFRAYVPGMKYSGNIFFRLAFFGNVFGLILVGWAANRRNGEAGESRAYARVISLILAGVAAANLAAWSTTLFPDFWIGLGRTLHEEIFETGVQLIADRPERSLTTAAGFFLTTFVFLFWWFRDRPGRSGKIERTILALAAAGCYLLIYAYQGPNLPKALDGPNNPIFQTPGLDLNARALTLENCSAKTRYYQRGDPTATGLKTLDGPLDTGIFTTARRFWMPLNDLDQHFEEGKYWFELNWVCAEKVAGADGRGLKPAFVRFLRILGVRYLFTYQACEDPALRRINRVNGLWLYEIDKPWSDVVFLPDLGAEEMGALIKGLRDGDDSAVRRFDELDGKKIVLAAKRKTNLEWSVEPPAGAGDPAGVLFMNHPLEYYTPRTFPLTNLPLEGRWQLVSHGRAVDFPLTDVPFRIMAGRFDGPMTIRYDLSQYRGWLPLSAAALLAFILTSGLYHRHRRTRME